MRDKDHHAFDLGGQLHPLPGHLGEIGIKALPEAALVGDEPHPPAAVEGGSQIGGGADQRRAGPAVDQAAVGDLVDKLLILFAQGEQVTAAQDKLAKGRGDGSDPVAGLPLPFHQLQRLAKALFRGGGGVGGPRRIGGEDDQGQAGGRGRAGPSLPGEPQAGHQLVKAGGSHQGKDRQQHGQVARALVGAAEQ